VFTEGYHELGNRIGGDVGAAINHFAAALGQATADGAVIVAGALDGNDQAVTNAEADLVKLGGDGLSSLGTWLDQHINGPLGEGLASAAQAADEVTQTVAQVSEITTDLQNGDALDAIRHLSGALHSAGGALDDAGNTVEQFGDSTGIGLVGDGAHAVGSVLNVAGHALNALGDVTDSATAGLGHLANLADVQEQFVGVLTNAGAKAVEHVAADAWNGVKNAGGDLLNGDVGAALGDATQAVGHMVTDIADAVGGVFGDVLDLGKGALNDIEHLFGGGDSGPPPNRSFQDSFNGVPPPSDVGPWMTRDSDGNASIGGYLTADGYNINPTDASDKTWVATDAAGNAVVTYQWDDAVHCWTKTDPTTHQEWIHFGDDGWKEVTPLPADFNPNAPPPAPPPPPPPWVDQHETGSGTANLGVTPPGTVSFYGPAIEYNHHSNVQVQARENSGAPTVEIGTGNNPAPWDSADHRGPDRNWRWRRSFVPELLGPGRRCDPSRDGQRLHSVNA
jgi:hypothetical protein